MPKNKTWEEKFDTWAERTNAGGSYDDLFRAYEAGRRHQRDATVKDPKWDETGAELAFWKETADDYRREFETQRKINDALGAINTKLSGKINGLETERIVLSRDLRWTKNKCDELMNEARRPWWKFWG
jgi:hypothetical protein